MHERLSILRGLTMVGALAVALGLALLTSGHATLANLTLTETPSATPVGSTPTPNLATTMPLTPPSLTVTPLPRPLPPQPAGATGCNGESGLSAGAGETIGLNDGRNLLQVTLPPTGSYLHHPSGLPPEGASFYICSIDTGASVTIGASSGRELTRIATTPAGNAIVDQIVAGARVSPASVLTGGTVRPPQAGDGGLAAYDR